ncbi:MAG: hypothetical protein ACHQUC_02540 [Chlamydiales bacterium]
MPTSFANQHKTLLPRKEVIRLLKERQSRGLPLNQIQVRKENASPYYSMIRYWTKWSDGLNSIGISTRKYRHRTKEMVMNAIKQRYESGLSLGNCAILSDDPSLLVQIRKFYGTKLSLLEASGIAPQKLSKTRLSELLTNLYLNT